jgi:hypothetical protein
MPIEKELFHAILKTKGRKSGKTHAVMLRGVKYKDKIYFSRHRPDGDWFRNALVNPDVFIEYNNFIYAGKAKLVEDKKLEQHISHLKYPGESRANEKRVALEITLYE